MKGKFFKRYRKALLTYLEKDSGGDLHPARGMGQQALNAGWRTLDMAKLHEQILIKDILSGLTAGKRARLIKNAGAFFSEAITPIEKIQRAPLAATIHLNRIVEMLSQRTVELAASNLDLELEIAQRKAVEQSLKKSERHYSELLEKSNRLQEQLRRLSRQVLCAQEDERKKISRELHDVIAQTLTGINVRLAALKKEAAISTKGLEQSIARTQLLVEQSVSIVHDFARELRPAVLDDLGLIPALHTFVKGVADRTGLRANMTIFAEVEQLDIGRRTTLFRVAQEALTNVAQHAKASRVDLSLQKWNGGARLEIKDDGKSFQVENTLRAKGGKRLGLLGMRERIEMVGGTFCVESTPGQGTMVRADIPFLFNLKNGSKKHP